MAASGRVLVEKVVHQEVDLEEEGPDRLVLLVFRQAEAGELGKQPVGHLAPVAVHGALPRQVHDGMRGSPHQTRSPGRRKDQELSARRLGLILILAWYHLRRPSGARVSRRLLSNQLG